jgi:hypothetical protein
MTALQELIQKLESFKKELTIKFQRKPTCFNRGMNLVNIFTNIFGSLK